MSAIRITEADLQRHPELRKRLGLEDSAESSQKLFEVSWYSPRFRKRVAAPTLIEAQTRGGAIAEVKAGFAGSDLTRPKHERPANFIATKRNPGMFGPEAVRDAKQVTRIRRIRHRHTREPGEIISVHHGGWVKVKLDNADQPALAKRSELELLRRSKRNPATPFFCADCDGELKGNAVEMKDGRVVCTGCARKAKHRAGDKQQGKLFDEQLTLIQNGKRQNVAMGFIDPVGVFHPIRASEDYNEFLTSDVASPAERRARSAKYQAKLSERWYAGEEIKRAKKFRKGHKSLAQFVRGAGGISAPKDADLRGELRMLGRRESGTTGLLNQHNRQGSQRFGPEYMMDAANTEGFRDRHGREFDNIGNFLGAVAEDAHGIRKYFSHEDLNYANPKMAKSKKKTVPKKRAAVKCSKCGGAHHASYCKAPKKNLFGLDRASRAKRHKKRARVSSAKATLLEAKDRLRAARKNTPRKAAKSASKPNSLLKREFEYQVNTKKRGRIFGVIAGLTARSVAKKIKSAYKEFGVISVRVKKLASRPNPLHPLEVGSHLAMILSGVQTARHMAAKKKKPRRPTASAAGKRLAQRRHHKNGIVEAAAGLQAAEFFGHELGLDKKPRKRRNSAGEIFEDFTGTRSTKVTTGYVAPNAPVNVDLLGPVTQLTLANGKGRVKLGNGQVIMGEIKRFAPGAVMLNAVQRNGGKRRFVVGVRKDLRALWLERNPGANGRSFNYGPVAEVCYRARKPHLYNGDKRTHTFYHTLGEEGGRRPSAMLQNGMPALAYGDYEITREGIRN